MQLCMKDLCLSLLSNEMNPCNTHRRSTGFEKVILVETLPVWSDRDRREDKNVGWLLDSQNSIGRTFADKTTEQQTNDATDWREFAQTLKTVVCPAGVQNYLGLVTPFLDDILDLQLTLSMDVVMKWMCFACRSLGLSDSPHGKALQGPLTASHLINIQKTFLSFWRFQGF